MHHGGWDNPFVVEDLWAKSHLDITEAKTSIFFGDLDTGMRDCSAPGLPSLTT